MAEGRACQKCGQEIPARRLAAVPDARYCIQCQVDKDEPVRVPESVMVDSWIPRGWAGGGS
jgi:hypothetical protein